MDFAQPIKLYGSTPDPRRPYTPAECVGTRKGRIAGRPNMDKVTTSYVERANLTARMPSRRFTRLSGGYSRKLRNHAAAVALHFMHYNFARIDSSLRYPCDGGWRLGPRLEFAGNRRPARLAAPVPMSRLTLGAICGLVYGALSAASMLPLSFPDKRAALLGAFINRFSIGLVIGAVALPWPGWLAGLAIGILLSLADAIITKAYAPILILGAIGGTLIGWIVERFGR